MALLNLLSHWVRAVGALPGEVRRQEAERRAHQTHHELQYALSEHGLKPQPVYHSRTFVLPSMAGSRVLGYEVHVEVNDALSALTSWCVIVKQPLVLDLFPRPVIAAHLERTIDGREWQRVHSRDLTEGEQMDGVADWACRLIDAGSKDVLDGLERAFATCGVVVESRMRDVIEESQFLHSAWYFEVRQPKPRKGECFYVVLAGQRLVLQLSAADALPDERLGETAIKLGIGSAGVADWVRSEIRRFQRGEKPPLELQDGQS